MILAGDVGGTNARLALFEVRGDGLRAIVEVTLPSRQHPNLETAARAFLASHDLPVKQACFGVAGPVARGRSETTNLPWVVDARGAAAALNLGEVWLINDLEATAYGIAALPPADFVPLNPGAPAGPS